MPPTTHILHSTFSLNGFWKWHFLLSPCHCSDRVLMYWSAFRNWSKDFHSRNSSWLEGMISLICMRSITIHHPISLKRLQFTATWFFRFCFIVCARNFSIHCWKHWLKLESACKSLFNTIRIDEHSKLHDLISFSSNHNLTASVSSPFEQIFFLTTAANWRMYYCESNGDAVISLEHFVTFNWVVKFVSNVYIVVSSGRIAWTEKENLDWVGWLLYASSTTIYYGP